MKTSADMVSRCAVAKLLFEIFGDFALLFRFVELDDFLLLVVLSWASPARTTASSAMHFTCIHFLQSLLEH